MNKIIAIAIDEYSDSNIKNLNNCKNDINSLIDILSKRYQFDSFELYTKPEQTTYSFLYNQLYDELINSLEEDNLLIIYAGHGEYNPTLETTYWICSDSDNKNATTWFNLTDLLIFFKASKSKHISLISDSCFSGAIFDRNRGGGISALENKLSRQALTSGGIEKVSDGNGELNSPFNIALQKILNKNKCEIISFNEISEKTIIEFNKSKVQTPEYGSLINSGDKGGAFFLKLIDEEDKGIVRPINIPLEITDKIKIESNFEIPFFNDNKIFKNQLINAFVQQLGYSIVNDIRLFVTEDLEYSISRSSEIEFYLEVGYTIETLNNNFLSILINRSDYFGGIHPNHYIYSLNFAFKPERKIDLNDILDCSDYQNNIIEFLNIMITKYGENDSKEIMIKYTTYEFSNQLDFSFNEKTFIIYYFNLFPHAFKAGGILEIPMDEIKLKIKK